MAIKRCNVLNYVVNIVANLIHLNIEEIAIVGNGLNQIKMFKVV